MHWHRQPERILDHSRPPFTRWFVGGETNLCHNALDRWLDSRPEQAALICLSSETGTERTFTYREFHAEVMRAAAMFLALGVGRGDRVLLYLPMIPEAVVMMLACVRIGAVHSVVFGGFAAPSLAVRIDDAKPRVIVSADAGLRAGRVIPYKHLLDEAIALARHAPEKVVIVNRGLAALPMAAGRDLDYARLRELHAAAQVPVTWLESNEASYILYTSGTTGRPKGVQRDTGGYAVALAASMRDAFCGRPGETYFCTSDIGWVVGHSYIVYGPLLAGMTTILYEGTPLRPDPAVLWSIVERFRPTAMFSSPTAIRVLKKQAQEFITRHDVRSLRALYLAGEPLDEPTARWVTESLGVPVIDNYWQTETGWPIITLCRELDSAPPRLGSPGKPVFGYNVKILDEQTGAELGQDEKGVVVIEPPLPPGCLTTVWGDDARFVSTYFESIPGRLVYSTFDWGTPDRDGYHFILGRTDDVINVSGIRLGTREIEESVSSHPGVAEVAVVGVSDAVRGSVPVAFVVLRNAQLAATADGAAGITGEISQTVDRQIGPMARPARVYFVSILPKTRSGKVLRRSIQAVCEGRPPGDLTTIEDVTALEQLAAAVGAKAL